MSIHCLLNVRSCEINVILYFYVDPEPRKKLSNHRKGNKKIFENIRSTQRRKKARWLLTLEGIAFRNLHACFQCRQLSNMSTQLRICKTKSWKICE